MAVVVLAAGIFLFDNLREKRSVPLTTQVLLVLKMLAAHPLNITARIHGAADYLSLCSFTQSGDFCGTQIALCLTKSLVLISFMKLATSPF